MRGISYTLELSPTFPINLELWLQDLSDLKKVTVEKETKSIVFRVRLTPHELEKLKAHAKKHGTNPSQVIHEYIRRLPNPKESIHHSRVMK